MNYLHVDGLAQFPGLCWVSKARARTDLVGIRHWIRKPNKPPERASFGIGVADNVG